MFFVVVTMESESDVEWSRSKITVLIEMYRDKEVLWNPKNPSFKNKNLKNYAWSEIASELKIEKTEAQTKMKSMTSMFQRELKKEKSGAGASQGVKWWAFDLLLFLKDKTTPRTTTEAGIAVEGSRIQVNRITVY